MQAVELKHMIPLTMNLFNFSPCWKERVGAGKPVAMHVKVMLVSMLAVNCCESIGDEITGAAMKKEIECSYYYTGLIYDHDSP